MISKEEAKAIAETWIKEDLLKEGIIKFAGIPKLKILKETKRILSKYIDTSEGNIQLLSLWLLGTYFHKQFETFPILQLLAQKRSGKTRTLKLLSSIAYSSDGSVSTSPTETFLFRHSEGALFFDELETISSKEKSAFRETLNAVYKKGNKIVRYKEAKGGGYEEEAFFPYYPLALANITGIGDVLQDRAIQIVLRRSNKDLTKLIEDFRTNKEVQKLKVDLGSMNFEIPQNLFSEWNCYIQGEELSNKELIPLFEKIHNTNIYGRSLEIFFPLFVIAYYFEDIDSFLETATKYVQQREEEDSFDDIDENLKNFISENEVKYCTGYIPISTILGDFRESLEEQEAWLNSKWLGRALKRLDLVLSKRKVNGRRQVIIKYNSPKKVELVEFVGSVGLKREGYNTTPNTTFNKKTNNNNTTNYTITTNYTNTTNTTTTPSSCFKCKEKLKNGEFFDLNNNFYCIPCYNQVILEKVE